MAKFFVGQRVKIKYSYGWPELAGEQGVIVSKSKTAGIRGDSEWYVAPDSWGSYWAPGQSNLGAVKFAPNSDQLEPIVDSGCVPCGMSYEEMMQEFKEKVS